MSIAAYEIALVHEDGRADFRLVGEFDLANTPELRRRLLDPTAAGIPVEVDLAEVTYLDSSALGVFVEAHKLAVTKGTTFRLVNPTEAVHRLLDITTLAEMLTGDGTGA